MAGMESRQAISQGHAGAMKAYLTVGVRTPRTSAISSVVNTSISRKITVTL